MHFPSSAKKKEKLRETSAHDATGSLKKTLNKNLMQLKHPLRKIKVHGSGRKSKVMVVGTNKQPFNIATGNICLIFHETKRNICLTPA
jgi:hypothetical protein